MLFYMIELQDNDWSKLLPQIKNVASTDLILIAS